MNCLFCDSTHVGLTSLPPNSFNGKMFSYYKCKSCALVFVDPIPNDKDLELIYPTSYQGSISKKNIQNDQKLPGLRFKYSQIYKAIKNYSDQSMVLDYGCGNGQFVYNAQKNGFKTIGIEFNPEMVKVLKSSFEGIEFYTVDEFQNSTNTYSTIYLSNVLEHFTNPKQQLLSVIEKLSTNGIVIIEGPLEGNLSLVNWFKFTYLKARKKISPHFHTNDAPAHIFYSNVINQQKLFVDVGLEKQMMVVIEKEWPMPYTISDAKDLAGYFKYFIGKFSIFISNLVPNYGNTFMYVGKKRS